MSAETRHEGIDTGQASELFALGAAVVIAVVIGLVFLGQQLAAVISAIGAGLRV